MKRLKLAFTFLILVMLLLIGYMFYENIELLVKKDAGRDLMKPGADFSLKQTRFVEMSGEDKVLEVDAKEAYYFKDGMSVELKEPRAVFYGKGGIKTFLRGAKGMLNTASNDVEVEDDVRVDSDGSYHIETSYVKYNNKDRTIVSDKKVIFYGKGFLIKGRGMKALIDKEKIYLNADVDALFDDSVRGGGAGEKNSN